MPEMNCKVCKRLTPRGVSNPLYGGMCGECLCNDRARLQAIVAKLPILADGTSWIPGRDSGPYHPDGFAFLPAGNTITWNGYVWLVGLPDGDFGRNLRPVSECYRTEAEARTATIAAEDE